MRKVLAAVALSLGLFTSGPLAQGQSISPTRNGYWFNVESGVMIDCDHSSGSGVIINQRRVLTAAHVVKDATGCTVHGHPIEITYLDARTDVAVLAADLNRDDPITPISCEGMKKGYPYVAFGYGYGRDYGASMLVPTGEILQVHEEHGAGVRAEPGETVDYPDLTEAAGQVHPGMSGGPVLDIHGQVAGIVVMGSSEGAIIRSLDTTALCATQKTPTAPVKKPVVTVTPIPKP